jgi:hypothetical protein
MVNQWRSDTSIGAFVCTYTVVVGTGFAKLYGPWQLSSGEGKLDQPVEGGAAKFGAAILCTGGGKELGLKRW